MNYDDNKRKMRDSLQRENQNTDDAQNLEKIDLILHPENFKKKIVTINLIKGYDFQHGVGGTFHSSVRITIGGPGAGGIILIG